MNNKKYLILVTNDDGIQANGIRLLIETVKSLGKVVVVAPDSPQSAKSHSISTINPVAIQKISESENYLEYSCSGTPVDCVKIAIHEILERKPDLIVSGINHGTNSSVSVLYSGTMAAAIEGSLNGISSIGFSVNNYQHDADFTPALPFVKEISEFVLKTGLEYGISLNVNFPDVTTQTINGLKVCRACEGTWEEKFVNANEPHGRHAYWLTGKFRNMEPDATDTDEYFINQGFASIVPIKADFNAYNQIQGLKGLETNPTKNSINYNKPNS